MVVVAVVEGSALGSGPVLDSEGAGDVAEPAEGVAGCWAGLAPLPVPLVASVAAVGGVLLASSSLALLLGLNGGAALVTCDTAGWPTLPRGALELGGVAVFDAVVVGAEPLTFTCDIESPSGEWSAQASTVKATASAIVSWEARVREVLRENEQCVGVGLGKEGIAKGVGEVSVSRFQTARCPRRKRN
jgi:hypothetical protein